MGAAAYSAKRRSDSATGYARPRLRETSGGFKMPARSRPLALGQTQPRRAAARHTRADTKAGRVSGGGEKPEIRQEHNRPRQRSAACDREAAGPLQPALSASLAGCGKRRELPAKLGAQRG
jgi:hypothetical protein